MSGVSRRIGQIAGVVALVAAFVPGGQVISAAAGAISAVSNTVSQLTAKPPNARGSTTSVVIDPNSPAPYAMGYTYSPGHKLHEEAYGPEKSDIPNPNKSVVWLYSVAGPIEEFGFFTNDFETFPPTTSGGISGYYNDHLWVDFQKGEVPEARALTDRRPDYDGEMVDWGPDHKLSGMAAALWTYRFDKKGKIFSGGSPTPGAIGRWVWAYDPRKDSTFQGGAGSHRIDDEGTWEWTENPALHALTYAYGRYSQNPARPGKIFGVGMTAASIDIPAFVRAANVNDANNWKVGGVIYEPGDKWNNLKLIMEAGGMIPVWRGAQLSCTVHTPMVPVDTITADDLADGEWSVPAMQPWRNRINSIVPSYRSSEHQWEWVPSEKIIVPEYVDEDGEDKPSAHKFELVQEKDQAAQLGTYKVVDAREIGPIILPLKPRFLSYKPGDCLHINIPDINLDHTCEVRSRDYDIERAVVTMSFVTNTAAKHPYALGQTGTAPPTPALIGAEALDDRAFRVATEIIRDRIVTSLDFGALQDAIGNVPDAIAAAVGDDALARNNAISDAGDQLRDGLITQAEHDALVSAANETFLSTLGAITDQEVTFAIETAIQSALTQEAQDRDQAIADAAAQFTAGLIDEAGLQAAIDAADEAFNQDITAALGAEQSERAAAIIAAVGVNEVERDAIIAQATQDFNDGLITQAGFDAQVAEANALFERSIDAARGNIFTIQQYIANDTQIIRNNDNAIEGIRYLDENGVEVVTPYNIFWEAFRIVSENGGQNTPFLYDPVADVVYMDTAFIQDLSVETIHIRDGAISQAFTVVQDGTQSDPVELTVRNGDLSVVPGNYFYRDRVNQSQNSGPMANTNSRRAEIGTPLVVPAGLFAGQTIFLNVALEASHTQNNGNIALEITLDRTVYTDAALTQVLPSSEDPRPNAFVYGVDTFNLTTDPSNLAKTQVTRTFVDVHIPSDREVWMVYDVKARILGNNTGTTNDGVYFTGANWSAILSKR